MAAARGCIVLAAYRPDPDSFSTQLQSIAAQTVTAWTTLVTCDSDPGEVAALVERAVPGDDRFVILPEADRLGFYRNFERGLSRVPRDVAWVALSDQDDEWYPEKLATLLPSLGEASLVLGQAVVTAGDRSAGPVTRRRVVGLDGLLVSNQVTGSLAVMRRDVLDLALPFPPAPPGAFHDHWLGVCAAALDGFAVVDMPVQRYVQHGSNVIGEVAPEPFRERLVRLLRGGGDAAGRRLVHERLGWRRTMAHSVAQRHPAGAHARTLAVWAHSRARLVTRLGAAVATGQAPMARAAGLALAAAVEPVAPARWSAAMSSAPDVRGGFR